MSEPRKGYRELIRFRQNKWSQEDGEAGRMVKDWMIVEGSWETIEQVATGKRIRAGCLDNSR